MIYSHTLMQHAFYKHVHSHLGRTVNEKLHQLFRRLSHIETLLNAAGRCGQS